MEIQHVPRWRGYGEHSVKRSGWLVFSAVVLIIAGIMRLFDAIWAFRYNGPVPDGLHDALFGYSLTTYAWVWLIVAAILIAAGLLVLSPSANLAEETARWIGIAAAAIAAITAITWVPYYPIWALMYVGIAIAVIYGLSFHEVEAKP
jgi:magnesium-transporting ATPase (P-type)